MIPKPIILGEYDLIQKEDIKNYTFHKPVWLQNWECKIAII